MSSTSTTDVTVAALALAAPGTLLVLATAAMLCALLFGVDPLWRTESLTLTEAAALRDNGEVARLIDLGADPNAPARVRAAFVHDDAPPLLTPLEAAVGTDRGDMIGTLVDHGAAIDGATWTRLMCFAQSIEADDAAAALQARQPAGASTSCDAVETPW